LILTKEKEKRLELKNMDFLSPEFFSSLLSIILIDLVLGGDNAIVIGLAARNLPKDHQKQAIFWGTLGAIAIRILSTGIVVWLLRIPGLLLAGGLLLIWMAYKLLIEEKEHSLTTPDQNKWSAIRTIIIADAAMGIDNVLAVAGASHGNFLMVLLGLLISIPIVVWGSTLVIKAIDRFPFIIYLGSAAIAYTSSTMIIEEPLVHPYFANNPHMQWLFILMVIFGVMITGLFKRRSE
jgi:YjbE family integral membrane protein